MFRFALPMRNHLPFACGTWALAPNSYCVHFSAELFPLCSCHCSKSPGPYGNCFGTSLAYRTPLRPLEAQLFAKGSKERGSAAQFAGGHCLTQFCQKAPFPETED